MASVSAIRDGLQARLATISGLRAFDLVKGKIPTPCAFVRPDTNVVQTYDGSTDWTFTVDVYVSLNSMRAAQDALDAYLPGGAKDVKAAIENDPTLDGAVDSARCDFNGSYGIKEIDDMVFLGCEFTVEVYA